jgi:hypothetical protein
MCCFLVSDGRLGVKNCETYSESFHTRLLIGRLGVFHLKYHAERFVFGLSVLLLFIFNMNYCELECNSIIIIVTETCKVCSWGLYSLGWGFFYEMYLVFFLKNS